MSDFTILCMLSVILPVFYLLSLDIIRTWERQYAVQSVRPAQSSVRSNPTTYQRNVSPNPAQSYASCGRTVYYTIKRGASVQLANRPTVS